MIRRRLPRSSVMAFLAAGVCAGLAFVAVRAQVGSATGARDVATTTVVVTLRDIDAGVTLAASDLGLRSLDPMLAPPGAIVRIEDAVDAVTVTPFLEGEVLARTRLAAGSGGGAFSIGVPPGSVAVTIVPDLIPPGVGPGDRVDVLATYTTARPYTATEAEAAVVLTVTTAGAYGDGGGLTLITDPFTAAELARADATAHLTVAVRGYEPMPEPETSASPTPVIAPPASG